jgi:probable phosphoglycerate mutase
MPVTTFFLIRHAEREGAAADLLAGRMSGVHLTEAGRVRAERIARRLAPERISHIFSSPLERALETAAPLARAKRLTIRPTPAFDEIDFGDWTGKSFSELEGDAHWRAFNRVRSLARIPGGEAAIDVQQRVVGELVRLGQTYPDQSIACFSHGDPIRFALMYFLGAPLDSFERVNIGVGSITVLTLAEWGPRIDRLNEMPQE